MFQFDYFKPAVSDDYDAKNDTTQIAAQIYAELGFKSERKYTLTSKQTIFIETALKQFERSYCNVCSEYEELCATQGFYNAIKGVISQYFFREKTLKLLGDSSAETSSIVRGIAALCVLSKEDSEKNNQEISKNTYEKLNMVIAFFGSGSDTINEAKKLFQKFLIRIAIRFQNALELLANHQDGLINFSNFISEITLQELIIASSKSLSQTSSPEKKVNFLLDCIFEISPKEDVIEKIWKKPKLQTHYNDLWLISDLLFKSPIKTNSCIYTYTNIDLNTENSFLFFPPQMCPEKENGSIPLYSEFSKICTGSDRFLEEILKSICFVNRAFNNKDIDFNFKNSDTTNNKLIKAIKKSIDLLLSSEDMKITPENNRYRSIIKYYVNIFYIALEKHNSHFKHYILSSHYNQIQTFINEDVKLNTSNDDTDEITNRDAYYYSQRSIYTNDPHMNKINQCSFWKHSAIVTGSFVAGTGFGIAVSPLLPQCTII